MKSPVTFAISLALLCAFASAATQTPAAPKAVTIADITLHRTAKDIPQLSGQTVTVTGVVLDDPETLSEGAVRAELRDGGSAIFLFTKKPALMKGVRGGDIVSVTGTVNEYYGDDEIEPTTITRMGSMPLPSAQTVSVSSLRSRAFQAQRFTIVGTLHIVKSAKRPFVVVQDATGEMRVITPTSWLLDSDIADAIETGTKATVTGAVSVYRNPNGSLDFDLIPESKRDVRVLPPSEIRRWALGAIVAGLISFFLALWLSRERSRRRAIQLETLVKRLKESEREREATDSRFRAAQSAASMASFTYDTASTELEWSAEIPALAWMGGLHDWAAIARHIQPKQLASLRRHARRLSKHAGTFEEEIVLRGENGEETALLIKGSGQGERHVSGVAIDVTERRRLQERLREAQKLEAVGRLAGGIAHDFNNLLTAIHGYSELLQEEVQAAPSAEGHIAEILKASRQASQLVSQLLAFSRKGEVHFDSIDLDEVFGDVVKLLRPALGELHSVRFEQDSGLKLVRADRVEMEQVVWNLAMNARDAMPQGGEVVLHTSASHGQICFEVSDSGSGMDEETKRHMFEPFFTTKNRLRGTGLSLATVYSIVQRMGGHIEVKTAPERGTTIFVSLPQGDAEHKQNAEAPAQAASLPPASVLIVEDEEPVRRLAASYLSRNGFQVWSAADAVEALALLDEHLNEISLIITDVIMPGMNGPEMAEAALRRKPSLKIMFMSGYTDQAAGLPASQLLKKPFTLRQLVEESLRMLAEESSDSSVKA